MDGHGNNGMSDDIIKREIAVKMKWKEQNRRSHAEISGYD